MRSMMQVRASRYFGNLSLSIDPRFSAAVEVAKQAM